jgi:glycosyltransferase 2 family protein
MKNKILVVVKLAIAALVLWWVIHGQGPNALQNIWENIRGANPLFLILAMALFFCVLALGACRWQLLLRTQGIHLSNYRTFWITSVGIFFNVFLIGATGGDVPKAWYIAQAAPDRRASAVLSIVVDRVIGLMGLFILASISVAIYSSVLLKDPRTRPLAFKLIASFCIFFFAIFLGFKRHWITSQPWWKKIWHYVPAKKLFSTLSESLRLYEKYPRILAMALLISVGVHVVGVLAAWCIGQALAIQEAQLVHYFVYCPLINAFAAIPATPGGLGIREKAFEFFFTGMIGVPAAKSVALSLLFYSATLVLSFCCGLIYAFGKPKSEPPLPSNIQSVVEEKLDLTSRK